MNFNKNFTMQNLADTANKQFSELQKRLETIESRFRVCMNGKTRVGLIGSFVLTLLWLAAFGVFYWTIRTRVDSRILLIAVITTLALIVAMLVDNVMNLKYYGTILEYQNQIIQLKSRVSVGKNSIGANRDTFMNSQSKGWDYPLDAGTSIPEAARAIEQTLANVEAFNGGFINGVKNFFYYAVVLIVSVLGSIPLFGIAFDIMTGISGESLSYDLLNTLSVIGLIIVCIVEIILAKYIWGLTDCTVTNVTLFSIPLGPIMFLLLILVATLLVMLVILVVSFVLAILGVVFVGAIAFASICGG